MKKKYEKPQIVFESFALSTNIASDCETALFDELGCARLFSNGEIVFTEVVTGCVTKVKPDQDGDGMWGTFCYHVPTGDHSFSS